MLIKTRTDIGFEISKEYEVMTRFKKDHPDFRKSETGRMIWYSKEELYCADGGPEDVYLRREEGKEE